MIIKEPLNGGLVQTRHARLLRPGELQQADDTILRPGDPAIHKAPGRDVHGAVSSVSKTVSWTTTTSFTSAGLGTSIAGVTTVANSSEITSAGAFPAGMVPGVSVYGTGIQAETVVLRRVSASTVVLSKVATASTSPGTVTLYFSAVRIGQYLDDVGGRLAAGTYVTAIASDTAFTVSAAPTGAAGTNQTIYFCERIDGIRNLEFDGAEQALLMAKAGVNVYSCPTSDIGPTATWTSRITGLSRNADSRFHSINYGNKHLLMTGFDPLQVVYYSGITDDQVGASLVTRRAGLLAVTRQPKLTIVDGSWSSLTELGNGWYYFLVTEVLKDTHGNEIESAYDAEGGPAGIQIQTFASQAINVDYLGVANASTVNDGEYGRNEATHWRVYMSTRQPDNLGTPDLSEFFRVAEVPVATTNITLADENAFQIAYAKEVAADTTTNTGKTNIALFDSDEANAESGAAGAPTTDITGCSWSADSNVITSSGAFTNIVEGMPLVNANNLLPYGCVVQEKVSDSTLRIDKTTEVSGSNEAIRYGNSNSINGTYAYSGKNRDGGYQHTGIFHSFNFIPIGAWNSGTVTGIEVEIVGMYLSDLDKDAGFDVALVKSYTSGAGATVSTEQFGRFTKQGFISSRDNGAYSRYNPTTIKLGGKYDTWGLSWSASDFLTTANFGVRLRKRWGVSDEKMSHWIDGVKVTVYMGGNSVNYDGENYPVVVVSDSAGESFGTSINLPPPIASTGDVWDGSVVINDVQNPSTLRASYPDEPESFPDVYAVTIQSASNDEITFIRRIQNSLIVGCKNSVKRLNYFPRETDADFTKGRCYEDLATDHGIVGPGAGALIDIPRRGSALAYVSRKGLMVTDGITVDYLNEDLDWKNLIEPSLIHRTELVVWPIQNILAMYYVPYGGAYKTKAIYFSYHHAHLKDGFRLPANGPITTGSGLNCATSFDYNGQTLIVSGNSTDGYTYIEDNADYVDRSLGYTPQPTIRTRQIEIGNPGEMGSVERAFLLADAAGNSTTGGMSVTLKRQNQGEAVTSVETITEKNTVTGGIIEMFPYNQAEAFDVTIAKSSSQTAGLRLHYFAYEVKGVTMDANQ